MPKEIKKHYNYLDLPYSSNAEEVRLREKVLIKILNTKEIKKGVKYTEKLNKVVKTVRLVDYRTVLFYNNTIKRKKV